MTDKDALRALVTCNKGSDKYLAAFVYVTDELLTLQAVLLAALSDAEYWQCKYNGTWPTSEEAEKT